MTIRRALAVAAAAVGILASNVALFATSASAGERRGHGSGYHKPAPRHFVPQRHYGHGGYDNGHRRNKGHGAGLALGIGALILGTIIANEAGRHHRDRYDD